MRTIAVIPARYRSNRLPGKPLAEIHGKPMIQRVYERVSLASRLDEVLVATDDPRILDVVVGFGGKGVMTSPSHASGSDRVAEAVRELPFELVVNVQGDLPLLAPEALDSAIGLAERSPGAIATLRTPLRDRAALLSPNVVKVVSDLRGFALYFSRSPIPWPGPSPGDGSSPLPENLYYKHIGLYVYPKERLLFLARTEPASLELQEDLEQLRAMAQGVPIRLADVDEESVTVDTEADLERARELVREREPRGFEPRHSDFEERGEHPPSRKALRRDLAGARRA